MFCKTVLFKVLVLIKKWDTSNVYKERKSQIYQLLQSGFKTISTYNSSYGTLIRKTKFLEIADNIQWRWLWTYLELIYQRYNLRWLLRFALSRLYTNILVCTGSVLYWFKLHSSCGFEIVTASIKNWNIVQVKPYFNSYNSLYRSRLICNCKIVYCKVELYVCRQC